MKTKVHLLLLVVLPLLVAAGCRSYAFTAGRLTPQVPEGRDQSAKSRLRILVFGDSGTANDVQRRVAKGMAEACAGGTCDFGLVLGDNIYRKGVASAADPQFKAKFHDAYDPLGLEMWVVPGNHDWYSSRGVQPEIDHTTDTSNPNRTWKMPGAFYGVPRLPSWIHLVGLDTTVLQDLAKGPGESKAEQLRAVATRQLDAARQALCGKQGWRILFGHHFVHSNGRHAGDSGLLAPALHPVIAGCQVQVLLSGHDHHQEHLAVKVTHEGSSFTYHQIIEGAASETRSIRTRKAPDVEARWGLAEPGFAILEASATELTVAFYACPRGQPSDPPCRKVDHTLKLP